MLTEPFLYSPGYKAILQIRKRNPQVPSDSQSVCLPNQLTVVSYFTGEKAPESWRLSPVTQVTSEQYLVWREQREPLVGEACPIAETSSTCCPVKVSTGECQLADKAMKL